MRRASVLQPKLAVLSTTRPVQQPASWPFSAERMRWHAPSIILRYCVKKRKSDPSLKVECFVVLHFETVLLYRFRRNSCSIHCNSCKNVWSDGMKFFLVPSHDTSHSMAWPCPHLLKVPKRKLIKLAKLCISILHEFITKEICQYHKSATNNVRVTSSFYS